MRRLSCVAMLALAQACSPAAPGNEATNAVVESGTTDHLRCAALISAADQLINAGTVPADAAFSKAALVAAMTHLNAYAIPKGLAEKDAFAAVEAEKSKIIGSTPAAQIVEHAKSCVPNLQG